MTLLVPLAFLAALAAAGYAALPSWAALPPLGAGTAALLVARRPAHVIGGLALLAAALGLLRAEVGSGPRTETSLARHVAAGPVAAARGVVADEPVPRDRAQQVRLRVDAVRLADGGWATTAGYAQLTTRPAPALHFGQILEVHGTVVAPEEPDAKLPRAYAAFLRRQGIDAVAAFPTVVVLGEAPPDPFRRALFAVRERLAGAIEALLPEPQAALVEGILVGRRATLPRALVDQLNLSGTSHIVAVSGFNVSVVVGVVAATLRSSLSRSARRRWLSMVLASGALWAFVALVGASGSVLRAAAMAQLALIGHALGRTATAGGLLLWGCAFLAAWQPSLLQDTGWQLSFLGTAGLIWLAPALATRLAWLPPLVREALAATVAAQVFVLPVLAGAFGRVSIVAPLANVAALPLVPPIMLGGAALVVAGVAAPPAAPLLAALVWVPTTALIRIVDWTAGLPGAARPLPPWDALAVVGYLAGLAALCWYLEWQASLPPAAGGAGALPPAPRAGAWRPKLALAGLGALACVAWAMAPPLEAVSEPPGLVVSVPAATEGGLALVRAPDGAKVLLGGGPTAGGAAGLLGEHLRPWDRTIDAVVLADPREPYLRGLAGVLERYRVGLLVDGVDEYPSAAYRQVRDAAQRRRVPRWRAEAGTELSIGGALRLEVVAAAPPAPPGSGAPSAARDAARRAAEPLAVRLRWGSFSLLVPGDGPGARQRALLAGAYPVRSTAVLLAERATRDPGLDALLRGADPELVVVQGTPPADARGTLLGAPAAAPSAAPRGTLAGFPAADTLSLEGAPAPLWHHTAADGPLRLEVRGDAYRIVGRR